MENINIQLDRKIWVKTPKEILHIILSYSNEIKFRNGRYIDRLNKEKDNRFKLLKSIRTPIYGEHTTTVCLFNTERNIYLYLYYCHYYNLLGNGHKTYDLSIICITKDNKYKELYKQSLGGKWYKFIEYTM